MTADFRDKPQLFRFRKSLWTAVDIMRSANPTKFWVLGVFSVLEGLSAPLFAVTAGRLVAAAPAAVRSGSLGSPEGHQLLWALGLTALVFAGSDALRTYLQAYIEGYKAEVNATRRARVMAASLSTPGIRHLEDEEFLDTLRLATSREWPDAGSFASGSYGLLSARVGSIGSAVLLAAFHWWLAVALVTTWMIIGFYLRLGQAEGFSEGRSDLRRSSYFRSVGYDGAAAKEVRIFGLSNWFVARYSMSWHAAMQAVWAHRSNRMSQRVILLIAAIVVNFGAFWLLADAVRDGDISAARLMVYGTAMFGIAQLARVDEMTLAVSLGTVAFPGVREVEEHLATDESLEMPGEADPDDHPVKEIVFENVSFTYPGQERPVYENFNLRIEVGKSLGIVGRNGAGKTTLIKLLCRLYDPDRGRILVDGVDLTSLDATKWQRRIAAIFQDFVRWQFSAADNVSLGGIESNADKELLRQAADRVGALPLIEGLPHGWDTVLSRQYENGADLSGGQWQRIALARAMFAVGNGSKVLVLDEPTANLDARAEVELFDDFLKVTRGTTSLLISHRFSTVRRADRIVVIENGQVVEDCTHDELVQLKGRYAESFRLQAERYNEEAQQS